jgi:hypothetical protein
MFYSVEFLNGMISDLNPLLDVVKLSVKDENRNKKAAFQNFLSEKSKDTNYGDFLKNIQSHLRALHLSSVDLNFLNQEKVESFTIENVRYDHMPLNEVPFGKLITKDGDTYFFTKASSQSDYCLCSDEDEGFNEKYGCCGIHCDFHYPVITQLHPDGSMTKYVYDGLERDLWD